MPILDAADRLHRLYELRDRITHEIAVLEAAAESARQRAIERRRSMADPAQVRAWAIERGLTTSAHGRLAGPLIDQYLDAHTTRSSQ